MSTDPISGNRVPPGAKPEEVRDDVPIMASEGEYVIPANVVRYVGLKTIEKMVREAKAELEELHAQGRMGGEDDDEDDELPFDPSELAFEDDEEVQHLAEGGEVQPNPTVSGGGGNIKAYKNTDGQIVYIPFFNGKPLYPIPTGYTEEGTTNPEGEKAATINPNTGGQPRAMDNSAKENGAFVDKNESPLAGSAKNWTPQDFITFGNTKDSAGNNAMKGLIAMLPMGKLALKARDHFLNKEASTMLDQMIETGVDLQGNPIAPDQITMLSKTREGLINDMNERSGLSLNPLEKLTNIFDQFTSFVSGDSGQSDPQSSLSPEATRMVNTSAQEGYVASPSSSDDQYSGDRSLGSDMGRDPSSGPSEGSMASGGLYNKGGLITRRKEPKALY